MTPAQKKLMERIKARGGAIQRADLTAGERRSAHALVDAGELEIDGGATASRGPFNQAAGDTLTFVTPAQSS